MTKWLADSAVAILCIGIASTSSFAKSRVPADERTIGDLLKSIKKLPSGSQLQSTKGKSAIPSYNEPEKRRKRSQELLRIKPPKSSVLASEGGSAEAEYEKSVDDAIAAAYELIKKFKSSRNRDKLWLRLAEQYVEKAKILEARIQRTYDEELERYQTGKTRRQPNLDLKPTRVFYLKAIKLYEWYMRDFPTGGKMDQALYFLGYTHFELGNAKKGSEYYVQLTKRYPQSEYVQESQFSLGEYHFDREEWGKAYGYYEMVVRAKHERLYQLAMYKLAWSAYKGGKKEIALKNLEGVIRFEGASDSERAVRKIRLVNEASKDLVHFYAETGRFRDAEQYFDGLVGSKRTPQMMEQLAYIYSDSGNRAGTHFLFKGLINKNPNGEKAFEYQKQIVNVFSVTGKSKVFRNELKIWVEDFGPKSDWARENRGNKDLVMSAQDDLEKSFRRYILEMHKAAQNSKIEADMRRTHQEYELYLQTFPASEVIDEMRFFHGELLYDMKNYAGATEEYLWIVDNVEKSKYFEKSLLNAMLATQQTFPSEKEIKARVKNQDERVEFDPSISKFIKVSGIYTSKFPKNPRAPEILYQIGLLHYSFNHNEDALEAFHELIRRYPESKQTENSANLILDTYNRQGNYAKLQESGQMLLAIPAIRKSKMGPYIQEIIEKSGFKIAQGFEQKNNYLDSAKTYEDFAKKNHQSSLVASAYFNAGVNYEKAHQPKEAIAMYSLVLSKGKDEKVKKKSRQLLGHLYQKTGQYIRAAQQYELYVKDYSKDPLAKEMLFNAGVIWAAIEEPQRAIRAFTRYGGYQSTAEEKALAHLHLGEAYLSQKSYDQAIAEFRRYLGGKFDRDKATEIHLKIAQIYERFKNYAESGNWYRRTVSFQKSQGAWTGPGAPFAAQARFQLIYPTYQEILRTRLPSNPQEQARVLKKLISQTDQIDKELAEVIRYDVGDWIVGSLAVSGLSNSHLYQVIVQAPLPSGISGADLEKYKSGVEQMASPFKDKALLNLRGAIEKSIKLEAYPRWVSIAKKELARYESKAYDGDGDYTSLSRVIDWMGLE